MNLLQELPSATTRTKAIEIATWAAKSEENCGQLIDIFLNGHYRITQRASWPLIKLADMNMERLIPFLGPMIMNLQKSGLHDAVKRNTVRILQTVEVPEEYMGVLADVCMGYLATVEEPIAVKAFSMTVLLNITKHYPDLKNELKLLIEEQLPHASPGLLNRGRKVLKALEKLPG